MTNRKVDFIGPCDILFRLMMGTVVTPHEVLMDDSWWTWERVHTVPLELAPSY